MKYIFSLSLFIFILILLNSCDSTTSPGSPISKSTVIQSFEINPSSIEFTFHEDGYKDTTVAIELLSFIISPDNLEPNFVITEKSTGNIVAQDKFSFLGSNNFNFSTLANITTTTTTIQDYIVNVFFDNNPSLYAQTTFSINGFSNNRPELLYTTGPEIINRPSSGEIPAVFTAKVTDSDGQETIDRVFIRVINQESGEVQGSPFQMFDDGTTYNDSTANDSVYTWYQPVPPNENDPNRDFDIEFFAIDLAGLSSDTVKTTFRIRE